uniref:Uncharacterized protein n=1 Tax=Meloidogyne javanica TaxID=6303 RepID=A0A915MGG7_MELJA
MARYTKHPTGRKAGFSCKVIDNDEINVKVATEDEAVTKLLELCNEDRIINWEEFLNLYENFKCIEKLGEGDYGEVIPITYTNSAEIIYSEVFISRQVSELNDRDLCFIKLLRASVVKGIYHNELLDKWHNIKSKIKTARFMFNDKEIKINTYGLNVKIIDFTNSRITSSDGMPIFVDLAEAKGIFDGDALEEYQFMFNDKEIKINTYGVNVKIIDFTNSRITNSDGMPIFVDLAEAKGIFDGNALEE